MKSYCYGNNCVLVLLQQTLYSEKTVVVLLKTNPTTMTPVGFYDINKSFSLNVKSFPN